MTKKTKNQGSGIFVYLGPNIRGIVTNGAIFRSSDGTKQGILNTLNADYPQFDRLFVPDREVSRAREQLAAGTGGISAAYKAVSAVLAEKSKEV